ATDQDQRLRWLCQKSHHRSSKLVMRVRFPSPAPTRKRRSTGLTRSPSPPRRWTHAPPHLLHAQKPPATPATHPPPEDRRHHHQPPPARLDATRTRPNAQRAPPWPPSSANGPCSASSPTPARALTGSTRPHATILDNRTRPLTTRHWQAIGYADH